MRLFVHLQLMVGLFAGAFGCSSAVGRACTVDSAGQSCTCSGGVTPNATACEKATVPGSLCCAAAGWPNAPATCDCKPRKIVCFKVADTTFFANSCYCNSVEDGDNHDGRQQAADTPASSCGLSAGSPYKVCCLEKLSDGTNNCACIDDASLPCKDGSSGSISFTSTSVQDCKLTPSYCQYKQTEVPACSM